MDVYKKLEEKGIALFKPTARAGVYNRVITFGDRLAYVSGTGPACELGPGKLGKLGKEVTLEEGREEARRCMLNILSNLQDELGDLNRIKRFVKMLAFVSSDPSFLEQPQVANGASELLLELFGQEAGLPTRSAVGVSVLPGDIPVEIEMLLELKA